MDKDYRDGLIAVAQDLGTRFAAQCSAATTTEALEEIAQRLALAGELLTRPPDGDEWQLVAAKE